MAVHAAFRSFLGGRNHLVWTASRCLNPQQCLPVVSVFPQKSFLDPPTLSRGYVRKRSSNKKFWGWFVNSGDLATREPLDKDAVKYYYKDIAELKSLSPEVQRIFTLDLADRKEKKVHERQEMIDWIFSTLGLEAHLERKIALATIRIRCMKDHVSVFWKDKRSKSDLNERIAKRRKWLKELRKLDFERFIWICKKLKLRYKRVTPYSYFKLSRRGRRKKKARKRSFKMKISKIVSLKEKLAAEKVEFDQHKAETLKQIQKDLKELNLTIDDVYDPKNVSKLVRVKKEEKKFVGRVWY